MAIFKLNPSLANVPILCPMKYRKPCGFLVFSGFYRNGTLAEIGLSEIRLDLTVSNRKLCSVFAGLQKLTKKYIFKNYPAF